MCYHAHIHGHEKDVICVWKAETENLKALSHQTEMPQRLYSSLTTCQRAVRSPQNTPKISHLSVIACTQRPHSVPTRRSRSVFIESMTLLRRASSCCCVFTARSRRAYNVLTARTQHAQNKRRRMAFLAIAQRAHS